MATNRRRTVLARNRPQRKAGRGRPANGRGGACESRNGSTPQTDDPIRDAGDLVCEVLTVAWRSMDFFEREAAKRGITVPQALAAAIAHGLAEYGLLRAPVRVN